MGVISFRVSDEMEKELKQQARTRGQKLTDFCKERITEDLEQEELNKVTLENRIEKLENEQRELSENVFLMSRFLYNFTVIVTDESRAAIAWEAAENELRAIKERE